jgi:hypothetical protein
MLRICGDVRSVKRLCEINPEIDSIAFESFSEELKNELTLKNFFYYFKILKIKHLQFEPKLSTLFKSYLWDYLNYNTNLETLQLNGQTGCEKIYESLLVQKNLKQLHLNFSFLKRISDFRNFRNKNSL